MSAIDLLARFLALENGFPMKVGLVDVKGVSERVGEARNLNQHCRQL